MKELFGFGLLLLACLSGHTQNSKGFELIERPDKKQVDVLFNQKLMTAYCYYDSIRKPILFPVNTVDGITVTRGYPIHPLPGERTDHPHHTGVWLNYESVNGLDFWNNSTAIPIKKRKEYGTIVHQKVVNKEAANDKASLKTEAIWIRPDSTILLREQTAFSFQVQGSNFIIDRTTTLTAADSMVVFKDAKDGMMAIRVARELEMPSREPGNFVDSKGNVTQVVSMSNEGVTGRYFSSEGLSGDSVWGTKGTWVMLTGKKEGRNITIAMIDHPSNPGYPAYWHARGYGLFAVNPLGKKIFSNGKEELNYTLQPGAKVTFRYRMIIHSGNPLTPKQMNEYASAFASQH
jgi:hypothetical protein